MMPPTMCATQSTKRRRVGRALRTGKVKSLLLIGGGRVGSQNLVQPGGLVSTSACIQVL